MAENLITILGPTASGKTALAAALANKISGEIISADSRQVYRGMDIGTGKDLHAYLVNGVQVPFYLIDIHDPGYEYNVFEFQKDCYSIIVDIYKRGKQAILCGGTGFYLDAILKGKMLVEVQENKALRRKLALLNKHELIAELSRLRPLHNTTDTTDTNRLIRAIEIEKFKQEHVHEPPPVALTHSIFGIKMDRDVLKKRITKRLKERLDNGLAEEVEHLLASGIEKEQLIFYGLEYKYVTLYMSGALSYNDMFQKLNSSIHQFAKRQMTWFRRMEKHGTKINWVDARKPLNEQIEFILSKTN